MGMNTNGHKKGFAEINVTPLVDVMLVLLIVFMMTAPLMVSGVQLNLPKTKKSAALSSEKEQVILSITKKGEFYLKDQKLSSSTWIGELKTRLGSNDQMIVFIRADEEVAYGKVAKAISAIKSSGIKKVSLITENIK